MWDNEDQEELDKTNTNKIARNEVLLDLLDFNYNIFNLNLNSKDGEQERTLYLAVIFQALLDATVSSTVVSASDVNVIQRQANSWFFSPTKASDFEDVCDLAGIDPDYTRTLAYKVIKSNKITFIRKRLYALLS